MKKIIYETRCAEQIFHLGLLKKQNGEFHVKLDTQQANERNYRIRKADCEVGWRQADGRNQMAKLHICLRERNNFTYQQVSVGLHGVPVLR